MDGWQAPDLSRTGMLALSVCLFFTPSVPSLLYSVIFIGSFFSSTGGYSTVHVGISILATINKANHYVCQNLHVVDNHPDHHHDGITCNECLNPNPAQVICFSYVVAVVEVH